MMAFRSEKYYDLVLKQTQESGCLKITDAECKELPMELLEKIFPNQYQPKRPNFNSYDMDVEHTNWCPEDDLKRVNLSGNKFGEIPEVLEKMPSIDELILLSNSITIVNHLPINLKRLILSHNEVESIDEVKFPHSLLSLTMTTNKLTKELQTKFYGNLMNIDLSNNRLESIGNNCFDNCAQVISSINFSENRLVRWTFMEFKNLKILNLSHNHLTDICDDWSELLELQEVNLSYNRLTKFPKRLPDKLMELNLTSNRITQIGPSISGSFHPIPSLKVLDLRSNIIKSIHFERILEWPSVERIFLADNDFRSLPFEFLLLKNLKSFRLDNNPIRTGQWSKSAENLLDYMKNAITDEKKTEIMERLQALNVTNHQNIYNKLNEREDKKYSETLTKREMMSNVRQTKTLDLSKEMQIILSEDKLKDIIGNNDQFIEQVNLSGNRLNNIPEILENLKKTVKEFDLSTNYLGQTIDDDDCLLFHFHSLIRINLSRNVIHSLHRNFLNLKRIRYINLEQNNIEIIPQVLITMMRDTNHHLEQLQLNNNQIEDISSIFQPTPSPLPHLTFLDLSNNNIKSIPNEFGLCSTLRQFKIGGNPCKMIRPAILAKGTTAILDYLKNRLPNQ
ncbi:hypothetical protein SNEBB_003046 [Seison nebaliae]|nr:hypothetical protein SNEBB_003046 [Seison nebaliae]